MTMTQEERTIMYVPRMATFLNRWFKTYDEARASLEAEGGYLLPYEDHFLVTVAGAIRELGLDPEDPDWARIGWDWARPTDAGAWERLKQKRMLAV